LKWKDNLVEDDEGKAEVLNEYFASVFTKEDISTVPEIDYILLQSTMQ